MQNGQAKKKKNDFFKMSRLKYAREMVGRKWFGHLYLKVLSFFEIWPHGRSFVKAGRILGVNEERKGDLILFGSN